MIPHNHNFKINSSKEISQQFISRHITDFNAALLFIKNLPYKRNADKNNLATVFTNGFGTCSTKHALLKQLAIENGAGDVQLKLGIFKMSAENTPAVTEVLQAHQLAFLPEAHNYLSIGNTVIDCTKAGSKPADFINDLIIEIEIAPQDIVDFKVAYHQAFLAKWLKRQELSLSLPELWTIREKCIASFGAAEIAHYDLI